MLSYDVDLDAGVVTLTGPDSTPEDLEHVLRCSDTVHRVVTVLGKFAEFRSICVALVISKHDAEQYGDARMLQLLAGSAELEVSIFFDLDAARIWLATPRAG